MTKQEYLEAISKTIFEPIKSGATEEGYTNYAFKLPIYPFHPLKCKFKLEDNLEEFSQKDADKVKGLVFYEAIANEINAAITVIEREHNIKISNETKNRIFERYYT